MRRIECPDCDNYFTPPTCKCGYVQPESITTHAYVVVNYDDFNVSLTVRKCENITCNKPGTMQVGVTGKGAIYCGEHYFEKR